MKSNRETLFHGVEVEEVQDPSSSRVVSYKESYFWRLPYSWEVTTAGVWLAGFFYTGLPFWSTKPQFVPYILCFSCSSKILCQQAYRIAVVVEVDSGWTPCTPHLHNHYLWVHDPGWARSSSIRNVWRLDLQLLQSTRWQDTEHRCIHLRFQI